MGRPSGKAEEKRHNQGQGCLRAEGTPPHPTGRGFQPGGRIRSPPRPGDSALSSAAAPLDAAPGSLHPIQLRPPPRRLLASPAFSQVTWFKAPIPISTSKITFLAGTGAQPGLLRALLTAPKGPGSRGGSKIGGGRGATGLGGAEWDQGGERGQGRRFPDRPHRPTVGDSIPPRERGADTFRRTLAIQRQQRRH